MKHLFYLLMIWTCTQKLLADGFEDKNMGISLTLVSGWKEIPVVESNKPYSIFEAIRNGLDNEFLTLSAFPSSTVPVKKQGLKVWALEMANAFHGDDDIIKTSEIKRIDDNDWYHGVFKVNGNTISVFNTIKNGYSYSLSFLTDKEKDKEFNNDVNDIMKSVSLNRPLNLDKIKSILSSLEKSEDGNFWLPQHFTLTAALEPRKTAPYAYSLYKKLLNENSADKVLIASEIGLQLFCMNIKQNQQFFENNAISVLSKFVGNKFKQDGIEYVELTVAPWEKAKEKVYLHKFRLVNHDVGSTHYIFYLKKNDQMDIVKFQLASYLDDEFEPLFEAWVLKLVEDSK